MGAVSIALVLACLWLLGNPGQVHACSCVPPGSPSEELDRFDAVFAGRVVSIQRSFDPNAASNAPGDHTTVGFQASAVWKGAVPDDVQVATPPTGGACGFAFEEGAEYIVYARADADEDYTVDICSRTALLSEAQEDIDALGDGDAPPTAVGPQAEQPQDRSETGGRIVTLGVVAVIAVIGAVLVALRTRRR